MPTPIEESLANLSNVVPPSEEWKEAGATLVDDLSGVTNAPLARTALGLGTAATHNHGDYEVAGAAATAQNNAISAAAALVDDLSGVTNQSTARTNLGLGSASTHPSTDFAVPQDSPIAKSTTYTMISSDSVVLATAGSGGFTITLPATPIVGKRYGVKKVDSGIGVITVVGSSGTIDGTASIGISSQYDSGDFIFDGTNWWRV